MNIPKLEVINHEAESLMTLKKEFEQKQTERQELNGRRAACEMALSDPDNPNKANIYIELNGILSALSNFEREMEQIIAQENAIYGRLIKYRSDCEICAQDINQSYEKTVTLEKRLKTLDSKKELKKALTEMKAALEKIKEVMSAIDEAMNQFNLDDAGSYAKRLVPRAPDLGNSYGRPRYRK